MATTPQTRSTLKHILNVSMPFVQDKGTGHEENPDVVWVPICDGITELTEEFNPDTDEVQYICDDKKTTILKSYAPSMEIEMGYQIGSELQEYFDVMSRSLPIGDKKNDIEYIRYNKNEPYPGSTNKFVGVLRGGTVQFSSIGGSAEDPLGSTMTINSRPTDQSSEIVGYVTVSTGDASTPKYVWTAANTEIPYLTKYLTKKTGEDVYEEKGLSTYIPGSTEITVKSNNKFQLKGTSNGAAQKKVKLISTNTSVIADTQPIATIQDDGSWVLEVTVVNDGAASFALQIVESTGNSVTELSVATKLYKFKIKGYVAPPPPGT